jgi:CDP-glycerol glycerophosphotransferase (TagB/SpsB family)
LISGAAFAILRASVTSDRMTRSDSPADAPARCLLFATERYGLPVLQPIADAARRRGVDVAWLLVAPGKRPDGRVLADVRAALAWRPTFVVSASNEVPYFLPGLKVQVFHGFNVEKRDAAHGHFRMRGLFDLYCTQGPSTTEPFRAMAREHGHFAVVETGWSKMDPLFAGTLPKDLRESAGARPVVMFGSTFTRRLSAAPHVYDAIRRLVERGDRYWLLTLHPKCDADLVERYRRLAGPHARFVEAEQLVEAEAVADVLVSDTSSIVSEFAVQLKPVVTFRNRAPKPHMIDVQQPDALDAAIARALAPDPALRAALEAFAAVTHPARDGRASERVLDAVAALARGELGRLAPKPSNWLRWLRQRREYGYWGPAR